MTAPLGASTEVMLHHLAEHPCKNAHALEYPCPCGCAVAILCSECGEPLFLAVDPEEWCEHAEVAYREYCVAGAA